MIKQREGLLAKLVAEIFLVGALAGFVSPETALAEYIYEGNYNMPDGTAGKRFGAGAFVTNNEGIAIPF